MRNFKLMLAAALLCMSLCACHGKSAQTADFSTEPPVPTVPVSGDPGSYNAGNAVKVGREEAFTYTDKSDNAHTTIYRIPALNFDTTEARQLNAIIQSSYSDVFEAAAQAQTAQKAPALTSLNYDANVNDDVVSLIIKSEDQSHTVTYNVYNYNKTTEKHLDNEGLLAYLQLDYEQTFQELKSALEDDYYGKFKYESFPNDYYYQLGLTTNETAVKQSPLFLNKNGELYAVCTEYASVGNGKFQVLLKI